MPRPRSRRLGALVVIAALVLWAGAACDSAADLLDFPIEFGHTIDARVDVGKTTGAAAGQPSPADASYPLALPAVPVDLASSNSDLAANRSKLRSVTFTKIAVKPSTNTLTSATPPLSLFIGPKGATSPAQGVKIATIPAIAPGATASVPAALDAAGQAAAQPWITSLEFTVMLEAALSVRAGDTVPGGAADLAITFDVKAIVNPAK
jgi:hypothetical protein